MTRSRSTRLLSLLLVTSLVVTFSYVGSGLATANSHDKKTKLDKPSRERLVSAIARQDPTVMLLFATDAGAAGGVASALGSLGASVRYFDADLGYIRAAVPTANADAATRLAGVRAAEIDFIVPLELPAPEFGATEPEAPPEATTPGQNPYMPTQDIGAPQFVAANPTYDGRGVTIGIVDTGVDLGHPALQSTTTGDRKITDWVTGTHPVDDNDPTWVSMGTTVTVVGGAFTVGSGATAVSYTGAPDGTWKFGLFNEASLGAASEYGVTCSGITPPTAGADLNRNGVCNETFAILWIDQDTVLVDGDSDEDFSDDAAMRPYRANFDVGEFGDDNVATATRESVPFVIEVSAAFNKVSLGIVSGAHGTHVAGIAAGNGIFGGEADGAAPGANIKSLRACMFVAGCTAHALFEGMIRMVKILKVDVVNMSIGGLPALNDGNNPRTILYNDLIDKHGVQLFLSAGNSGPGINTIGDPSVATKVVSVGASWTSASVLANYGNVVTTPEALHDFSSRGPREDGGFKPQIVAPGNATSSVPTWQPQQCLIPCNPGLGMFNGTSMASPQAAGAGALLVSAAKQADVPHKPEQLRTALISTARFLPGYQAYEQGTGLINVGNAWALLTQSPKKVDISSSVPVNSLLSGFLATPGVGTGIYEREGITVATPAFMRRYTFTRTDGGKGTFNLSWIGNDGTFSTAATSISFSRQSRATLAVTVNPSTGIGAHSAILVLDDPTTPGIEYQTLNTVAVSAPLNAGNGYTATIPGTALQFEANQPKFFFQVPAGATAMKSSLEITNNGRARWFRMHPWGQSIDPSTTAFFTGPLTQTRSTAVVPLSGSWELAAAASRAAVPVTTTMNASMTAYKVTLSPNPWTVDPTTVGTTYSTTFTATNDFATGNMGAGGTTALASTREEVRSIASDAAPQEVAITVPTGTSQLVVTLGNASDLQADLDVYVYQCTAGPTSCTLRGSGTTSSSTERVAINNPAPGAWKAVIDPFSVPSGSTTFTYGDQFANTAYGTVTAVDPIASHASGLSWTFSASARALVPAETGRFFRGSINVRLDSATGFIIGTANVDLRNVGP